MNYLINIPLILSLKKEKRKIILGLLEKYISMSSTGLPDKIIKETLITYSYLITKEESKKSKRNKKIEKIVK